MSVDSSRRSDNLRAGVILVATFGVLFAASIAYILMYH